ncbi:hypothetical protein QR680_013585 [Steinernema hermaphroditum]|uniref:ZSWIM3 N-terminal domain-containing protein n=1 Tax=Steinernema hermaphroditum TaxID=289476 RepID=A0AA39M1T0_9BILA|nr:hypothetical protein QR680_013585 [Steinernema hermaphroditum]
MERCATLQNPTAKWVLAHGVSPFGIYDAAKPSPKEPSPDAHLSDSPSSSRSPGHSDDDTHSRGSPSSLKENVADIKMETDDQLAGPSSSESTVPLTKPLKVEVDDVNDRIIAAKIHQNAKFHSFAEFHEALEAWKRVGFHSFRIASSEKMKSANQALMDRIVYRYVVYHCAHYGPPRMRGDGHRPNQNYLPCGCKAMMRLNYSHEEDVLRLTSLTATHTNHEVNWETFSRINSKTRRSHIHGEFHSPVTPKQKTPASSPASTSPPVASVPLQAPVVTPASQWSPPLLGNPSIASLLALQQQQMMQRQQAALDMLALQRGAQTVPVNPAQPNQILPLLQNFLGLPSPSQQSPPLACIPPLQFERPKVESAKIPDSTPIDLSIKLPQPIAQNPTQCLEASETLNRFLLANEKTKLVGDVVAKLTEVMNRSADIRDVRAKVGQLQTLISIWEN